MARVILLQADIIFGGNGGAKINKFLDCVVSNLTSLDDPFFKHNNNYDKTTTTTIYRSLYLTINRNVMSFKLKVHQFLFLLLSSATYSSPQMKKKNPNSLKRNEILFGSFRLVVLLLLLLFQFVKKTTTFYKNNLHHPVDVYFHLPCGMWPNISQQMIKGNNKKKTKKK